jgi:dolichol-phosphate mannosyltransferase
VRYSFVVPIYKDADLADEFAEEFQRVFRLRLGREDISGDVELIFVNDGSPDPGGPTGAAATLDRVATKFAFVKVVELSRNFGQHVALSAGYRHARGAYVGMLNVDMEDPPDQIPLLLDEIEKGEADMVYATRGRKSSPWHIRLTSRLFNWLLIRLTGFEAPLDTATLRVMSRPFVDAYNGLTEKSRYLPGLEMWLGFKKAYLPIRHQARKRGRSSYTFRSRLRIASEAVISFSDLPLWTMVAAGTVLAALGFLLNFAAVTSRLFSFDFQPGYASMASVILLLGGVQIMVMGLATLYIGRILREVQNRPLYVVRRRTNFDDPGPDTPCPANDLVR